MKSVNKNPRSPKSPKSLKSPFCPFALRALVLSSLLIFAACQDDRGSESAGELLVTVSGTCTAEIKLYDYNASEQLDKQYYDCQHIKFIQFRPPQTGLYILIATSGDRTVKAPCSFVQGTIKEITVEF